MKTLNTNLLKKSYLKNRKAITFVELMICLIIASLIFGVAFTFLSTTNKNYMYGLVNLQNLQNARLVINYLRRDFTAACPRFDDPEKSKNGYVNIQRIRNQIFYDKENLAGGDLIDIKPHKISFHKYVFGSSDKNPIVEPITYEFNSDSHTLTRTSKTRGKKVFSGIEDAKFALYVHKTNPNIPLLWVKLKIQDPKNINNDDKLGKSLEINTTISSTFVNSSLKNRYWRYEIGHESK